MDAKARLIKTDKGREEIDHRRYKLAGKQRTLLILVDGTRSLEDLTNDGRKLGAPDDALILLLREGFVTAVTSSSANTVTAVESGVANDAGGTDADEFTRFRAAHKFMNDTAVDNMGGLKKFTFTLKLERCSVRQDLTNLLDDYRQSLAKAIGPEGADVLVTKAKALLS